MKAGPQPSEAVTNVVPFPTARSRVSWADDVCRRPGPCPCEAPCASALGMPPASSMADAERARLVAIVDRAVAFWNDPNPAARIAHFKTLSGREPRA